MKLLFKDDSYLISDLLGFVDADFKVSKLKSELYAATTELISLVGNEAYQYAIKLYEKPTADPVVALSETEAFHLYNFQYALAVDAYRHYVPAGDLSHSNNGRKMRNDDHEKAAFEWMINKNDVELEKRYYAALDNLLKVLDADDPKLTDTLTWKQTTASMALRSLLVYSTEIFDIYFPMGSRLLLQKLQPGLKRCEEMEIKPRMAGQEKDFKAFKTAFQKNEDVDDTLLALICEACVYYALAWGIPRLRVQLLPSGVVQHFVGGDGNVNKTQAPAKMETELATKSFTEDYKRSLKELEAYLAPVLTEAEKEAFDIYPQDDFDECDRFIST